MIVMHHPPPHTHTQPRQGHFGETLGKALVKKNNLKSPCCSQLVASCRAQNMESACPLGCQGQGSRADHYELCCFTTLPGSCDACLDYGDMTYKPLLTNLDSPGPATYLPTNTSCRETSVPAYTFGRKTPPRGTWVSTLSHPKQMCPSASPKMLGGAYRCAAVSVAALLTEVAFSTGRALEMVELKGSLY